MKKNGKSLLIPFSINALVAPALVAAAPAGDVALDTVLITTQRAERSSRGATGLDLDIKDTPQSISVVTSQMMDDYGADNLNDALRLATGINVEEWETNRTNYLARGFEIKNTQLDGVGLPNNWGIVTGAVDTFGFEKLEVIRGANGLLTGVGNSAGTINFVRKRPTNDKQGIVSFERASWDRIRVEADYSTPLTESGAWAGRLVAAYQENDSYLRDLSNDRTFVYGVIDGQLGERTTLAVGYSYQRANTDGNMWGALVLSNSDGTQAVFDRSTSPTQDWTYWNTINHNAFTEVTFALNDNWSLKGTYNYRASSEDDQLFFVYSSTGLDPVTGEGLVGYPGKYSGNDHAHLGDLTLSGTFSAFGREHEAMFGISQANSMGILYFNEVDFSEPAFGLLPPFPFAGDAIPEPAWGEKGISSETDQRLRRAYGVTRLSLTDRVKTIVGYNYAEYHREGQAGNDFDQTEHELSPYAGVTVDVTSNLLAYASYSDIYQPQDYYDIDNNFLDPSKGKNFELGMKASWLDGRLLGTLAGFTAEQTGLGTYAGLNSSGNYYYEPQDVDSKGVELELFGKAGQWTDIVFGVTQLDLEDGDGEDTYEWVPRTTVNLVVSSRLPQFPKLTLGVNGRWQSAISNVDGYSGLPVDQDAYAILNVFGHLRLTDNASLYANVKNVTDEKNITSLYNVGYYGPARNYSMSLSYRF